MNPSIIKVIFLVVFKPSDKKTTAIFYGDSKDFSYSVKPAPPFFFWLILLFISGSPTHQSFFAC